MATIVDGFSKRHKQQVVEQGAILHENGVVHVIMRAGANQQLGAEKTPGMQQEQGAQLSAPGA